MIQATLFKWIERLRRCCRLAARHSWGDFITAQRLMQSAIGSEPESRPKFLLPQQSQRRETTTNSGLNRVCRNPSFSQNAGPLYSRRFSSHSSALFFRIPSLCIELIPADNFVVNTLDRPSHCAAGSTAIVNRAKNSSLSTCVTATARRRSCFTPMMTPRLMG